MKKVDVLGLLAAATLALGVSTSSANAASYVFNFSVDPSTGNFFNFSGGGLDYQTYAVGLGLGGPVVLNSGDDITANITLLNVPLVIPSGTQFVGVNLNLAAPFDVADPANASTSGQFNFSGLAGPGAVFPNPFPGGCGNCLSNIFGITGQSFSFTGVISAALYNFDGGPVTLESMSLSYQVTNPSEVPLPAALPLFATVLAGGGLAAWRRKRKAVAATN